MPRLYTNCCVVLLCWLAQNVVLAQNYRDSVRHALSQQASYTIQLIDEWRNTLHAEDYSILGETYVYQGEWHLNREEYTEALMAFSKAEELWKKKQPADPKAITVLQLNFGRIYFLRYDYKRAVQYYFKALNLAERIADNSLLCELHSQLGETYLAMKDYTNAIKFLERGIEICAQLNDVSNLASMENTLAVAYSDNGEHEKAIKHYERAYKLCEQMQYPRGMYFTASNMGYEFYLLQRYTDALYYYNQALKIVDTYRLYGIEASALLNMSYVYFDKGNYKRALELQQKSLSLAQQAGKKIIEQEACQALSRTYEQIGQLSLAMEYLRKAVQLKDELEILEQQEAANQIAARYELDKAEIEKQRAQQQLAIQRLQVERQRYILILFAALAFFALLISYVIWRQAEQRRRTNEKLRRLNQLLQEQKEEIKTQNEQLSQTNNKLIESIRYAQRIQAAVFPSIEEFKMLFPDSVIFWRAKDIVSGDFYWCTQKNGFIYLALSDCTGHGVPGGFMTIMGITFLNQILHGDGILEPASILKSLDERIIATLQQHDPEVKDGMDIALLRIDQQQQKIVFSSARQRMHLFYNKTYQEIAASRYSIGAGGLYRQKEFTNTVLPIVGGTTIYLHTDGYLDQFDESNKRKFKINNFRNLLKSIHQRPFHEQAELLASTFDNWRGSQAQTDDVLVIGLRL